MKLCFSNTALLVVFMAFIVGCASTTPRVNPDDTYLNRSVTKSKSGITVSASVLYKKEIETVFGARLDSVGIQPVWLQHHSVKRNWPDVETEIPIITRLDELAELLPMVLATEGAAHSEPESASAAEPASGHAGVGPS